MRALLAGFGGIGKNVYFPELEKLGYRVDILDKFYKDSDFSNIDDVTEAYDIAVVCTPNSTHFEITKHLALTGTKEIFVEKPGVRDSIEWTDLCTLSDANIHLVKNNLYRDNYGHILSLFPHAIGVDINWLNDNRIPNPGNWSTNKDFTYRGVSGDLMPHLYCFAVMLFGFDAILDAKFEQECHQRWDLKNITNTGYGVVDPLGTYNVDDYATARTNINGIPLKMTASWKEGYNKQSVTLYFADGSTHEWIFGLCPSKAYGVMLQDTSNSTAIDTAMHHFFEGFKLED